MDIVSLGEKQTSHSFEITDIKQAVKNENRVNIFVDGKYDFSLDIAQVVDFKIKKGQHISEKELEKYRHASEYGKLYQRTLEWVLLRPRSVRETDDYLKRKKQKREQENRQATFNRSRSKEDLAKYKLRTKIQPEITTSDIEQVVFQLIDRGYLDDKKFAAYFVENRFAKKGISAKRLKMELQKKGISQGIIEEALGSSERSDEEEIKKIIAKKRSRYDNEKLIAYLTRQGFSYQLSRDLVLGTD